MSDDPMKEHKIHSPGCIFINGGESGNVPLRPGDQKEIPEPAGKVKGAEAKPEPMEVEKGLNEETALDKEIRQKLEKMEERYGHSIEYERTKEKFQEMVRQHSLEKKKDEENLGLNLSTSQPGSLFRSQSHPPHIPFHERSQEEAIPSEITFGTTIFSNPGEAAPYNENQVRALTIAQIKTELRSGPPFSVSIQLSNNVKVLKCIQLIL